MSCAAQSPCFVYDFTHKAEGISHLDIVQQLKTIAKKFTFQLERGDETGYMHYQGRFSLKEKMRKNQLLKKFTDNGWEPYSRISPTSRENSENNFYVSKEETRVAGPWTEKNTITTYIPRQYRELSLRPWQLAIFNSGDTFEPRKVNFIVDTDGGIGKSTVRSYCALHRGAVVVPVCNDAEKLKASVCDILMATENREPKLMFIDLPRSFNQQQINGIMVAIEEIKDGRVYDMRYSYREWWFDSPTMWVFMNTAPDVRALSKDRFVFWRVHPSLGTLVRVQPEES